MRLDACRACEEMRLCMDFAFAIGTRPGWQVTVMKISTAGFKTKSGTILLHACHGLFLFALVVNILYPPILLRSSSVRFQREVAAMFDVFVKKNVSRLEQLLHICDKNLVCKLKLPTQILKFSCMAKI